MSEQRPGNRSEVLEPFEDFVRRHVGPSDEEQEGMLKVLGYDTLDALVDAAVPGSVRSLGTLDLPPAVVRAPGARRAAPARREQHHRRADDRPRLLRDHHAGRHPAQRAREPGLVHGVHALPARDQPGSPGGAPELPDHGERPDRARHGQRLAARREHRGGRGRDPHAPPRHQRLEPGGRRCRLPAADHRRAGDASRAAGDRPSRWSTWSRRTRGRLLRPGAAVSRVLGRHPGLRGADRRRPRQGRAGDRGHGPAGADAAEATGGVGRRRRRRLLPAIRRAALVRRAACGIHGGQGRTGAGPARTPRRALHRRRGPARLPAGPADPRTAHPPGEGDLEHLHRPGPAGRGGLHVRRVPRRRGAARHCPPRAPPHGRPGRRRCEQAGFTSSIGSSSTRCWSRCPGRAAAIVADAARRGVLLRLVDDDHVGISCGETTTAAHVAAVLEAFGAEGGGDEPRRRRCPRRSCAGARSWATRCSPSTTPRRPCSATCAGCRTRTSRSTAA